jgi:transposase
VHLLAEPETYDELERPLGSGRLLGAPCCHRGRFSSPSWTASKERAAASVFGGRAPHRSCSRRVRGHTHGRRSSTKIRQGVHLQLIARESSLAFFMPSAFVGERDPPAGLMEKHKPRSRLTRGFFTDKGALKEGRTIVFCDQSGFYLLPMVVRTYAPIGQTPILKENLTRDHLSAMSGITLEGKLYMIEQERAFKGDDVVRFLKHLMRQIPGKLLLIWDGSPIHRGGAVKDFLASGAARRVQLEQLPGYAPDLNPDEGIWKHLKCVELKNLCCESLAQLKIELRKAKERLRHKRDVILGCIREPGFEV